ncbi:MAG: hypothetical protein H7Y07_07250 [Pyrinomonadaceae bacterium]|nr:hypothetical protein [Sphingobacteriaceae bacterium]
MSPDPLRKRLFEMRLIDIHNQYAWLEDEITQKDFIKLFPVVYKKDKAILPDKPIGYDLDRNIFLAVLVAFRQSFN